MKLQGNGAERFAKKPDPNCQFALIFGADEGVVADAANPARAPRWWFPACSYPYGADG